ncbi:MAG TPA: division/cell wall cluster transcriptional repressor MraZ [Solirubrobacteraceae bacterium]|nr:division/cell wall cluster transcriptional repressor MraZ [Solirubrobacteraceae bacterium]
MAFRGTFDHTLDAKNRLTVPARFRAALAEGVVLASQPDESRSLSIWRPHDYDAHIEQTIAGLPPSSPQAAHLRRFFYANSSESEVDGAGRVIVPPALLRRAGLGREVVIAGAGQFLEVWDRNQWAEYNEKLFDQVGDLTASLGQSA